jgi:hypothetical protein
MLEPAKLLIALLRGQAVFLLCLYSCLVAREVSNFVVIISYRCPCAHMLPIYNLC